jgi:hypothetical protein
MKNYVENSGLLDVTLCDWASSPRGMLDTEDDGKMLGTVPNNKASPEVSKFVLF